jgi:ubiquinone biosynthesis protein COQ9
MELLKTVEPMDNMDKKRQELKDKLLEASLPHIIFDGWSLKSLRAATSDLGIKEGMIYTVFVDPESELIEHFSDWADRRMLARLDKMDLESMKVRERITKAVRWRLEELSGQEEALRRSILKSSPRHLYKTVDLIWRRAGDKAVDFNFYSKRALLAAVLSSTTLYWLDDKSENHAKTWEFLDRRISDVMRIPKVKANLKKVIDLSVTPIAKRWGSWKTT